MESDENSPRHHWFAVRTRINYEKAAFSVLSDKGFESFLPLYRERRSWSDRIKQLEIPLFPGYFFCRTNLGERLNVLNTPGVMSVLGSGRIPVPIPDVEVDRSETIQSQK